MRGFRGGCSAAALAVGLLLGFGPDAAANLVINGDFEAGTAQPIPDWDGLGAYVQPGAGLGGSAAAAFNDIDAPGFISQDVPTVAGQSYTFSFWYASDGLSPNEFVAQWGGATLFHVTNDPQHDLAFHSFHVVATGATTTIAFGGRDDPGLLYLDTVSVTPVVGAAPVPEPSTLLAGLIAVAAIFAMPALRRLRARRGPHTAGRPQSLPRDSP